MSPPARSKTVLIIEDNDIQREGMAAILRQAGYTAVAAESVDVALAYSENTGVVPKLILSDMMMPGKDGWQFLQLRKQKPALASVPVVIATGLGVAGQEWARALGAAAVLKKPFDAADLLREVEGCFA
jgi:CheY-like chemotaxis protein